MILFHFVWLQKICGQIEQSNRVRHGRSGQRTCVQAYICMLQPSSSVWLYMIVIISCCPLLWLQMHWPHCSACASHCVALTQLARCPSSMHYLASWSWIAWQSLAWYQLSFVAMCHNHWWQWILLEALPSALQHTMPAAPWQGASALIMRREQQTSLLQQTSLPLVTD